MTNLTPKASSLRIAMVSPTLGTAFGLEQVLMISVEGLRKRGHEIFLIGETANESLPKTEAPTLIPGLFSTPELIAPQQLKKVCRDFEQTLQYLKPDLIHFLDQPPAEIIEFATQNYPCALTAHTVAPTCPASHRLTAGDSVCEKKAGWSCLLHNKTLHCLNGFKTDLHRTHVLYEFQRKRKATKKMKAILAISQYIESELLQNGFSREQIKLVYNPLPSLEGIEIAPHKKALIVSACRLVPLKGLEFAIRALKKIESLDWEYWILGDGPLKASLSRLVQELNLENRIHFKGKCSRQETLQTIANAKLFLQPNVGPEGFGLSVAEALSLGTPAIAFNTPALNEIIEPGKNGYLVSIKDTDGLSQAIQRMLFDDNTRTQLAAYGREKTPVRFSETSFLDSTEKLYQEMVTS